MKWSHFLALSLTIGMTQWDVISDILNGANYLATKNVTRQYDPAWYPNGMPDLCVDFGNKTMECPERDLVWGGSSIGLVQAPMLLGGQFLVMLVLLFNLDSSTKYNNGVCTKALVMTIVLPLLILIPYPLLVLAVQIAYILKPKSIVQGVFGIEWSLAEVVLILVSLEAAAESGPQALLQLYIAFSDQERELQWMTILTLVSSIFTIAKASITLFTSETNGGYQEKSLSAGEPSVVVGLYSSAIRFLPVFCTSIIFRVTSCCITLVLFQTMAFIPLAVGAVTITVLSFKRNIYIAPEEMFDRIVVSLQHGFGGLAVLASSFLATRDKDQIPMLISSVVWLITHSITFLVIIIMVNTPQCQLQHWKNTARIPLLAEDKLINLYIIMGIVILIGIINIFLVWFQIYKVEWYKVNWNIEKRMGWIRGEVQGDLREMPEVGSMEHYLRIPVDKLAECWTTCKQQSFASCFTVDKKANKVHPESQEVIKLREDDSNSTTQEINFVSADNGMIPPNAFPVKFYKGETFYLARAKCGSSKIPGYLVPSKRKAYVSWGLRGVAMDNYEVLVESEQFSLYWVDASKGSFGALGAVGVGTTVNGDLMYLGRAKVDNEWRAGKINARHSACFIASHLNWFREEPYDSEDSSSGPEHLEEYEVKEYEVLCRKPNARADIATF